MAKKITPPERALLDKILIQRLCTDPDATWNGKPGITLTGPDDMMAELMKEYERTEK